MGKKDKVEENIDMEGNDLNKEKDLLEEASVEEIVDLEVKLTEEDSNEKKPGFLINYLQD